MKFLKRGKYGVVFFFLNKPYVVYTKMLKYVEPVPL